ncbi:MAG: PTS transporter subunit EIIC [Lachnospiraceae bacterium]|nr:PTS transporter subunit EIIC [Lachnospiraceae bacterium]
MSEYEDKIALIIRCMGGADNIVSAENCMTRLRITVKDESLTDITPLETMDGVLGLVHDKEQYYQIVVGPGKSKKYGDMLRAELAKGAEAVETAEAATEVAEAKAAETVKKVEKTAETAASETVKKAEKTAEAATEKTAKTAATQTSKPAKSQAAESSKKFRVKEFLKIIGGIFIPLIPGVMTAGLCAGFAAMLTQLCPGYADSKPLSVLYNFLTLISASFMTYMTAWAGYRAAERFGATPILGGMLGMITSLDGINKISSALGLYDEQMPLSSVLCAGKGGVLAVIFGVYILSIIEKRLRRKIPDSLQMILTPFLAIVTCAVLYIGIVMPVFGFISGGIASAIGKLCLSKSVIVRVITGYISAALFLPLVATGMHHGLVALYTVQLQEIGYVILYPALAMAGAGQVGAAIAIIRKAKRVGNKALCRVANAALPAGVLGVGEPLIYGVTLPLGRPFVTASIGAGFGGAFIMTMEVASTTWGPSGVLGVFVMTAGPHGFVQNAIVYMASLLISAIGGYLVTQLFFKEKELIVKDAAPAQTEQNFTENAAN